MPGTTQALSKTTTDTTQALSYLWTAFTANEPGWPVLAGSSADGVNWTSAGGVGSTNDIGQSSPFAPSLAFFNGTLYGAYVPDDGTNNVYVTSTGDGMNWTSSTNTGQSSRFAPSLAVYNGTLYCAYVADDDTKNLYVASYDPAAGWTSTYTGHSSSAAPSLAGLGSPRRPALLRVRRRRRHQRVRHLHR